MMKHIITVLIAALLACVPVTAQIKTVDGRSTTTAKKNSGTSGQKKTSSKRGPASSKNVAVTTKSTEDLYQKAEDAFAREDYATAFKYYRQAATKGHTEAMWNLGFCYMAGYGVDQDQDTGYTWILKAANKGFADAMTTVGICYKNGLAVEQDYTKAYEWFSKAIDAGDTYAEYMMGELFEMCDDMETAEKYYRVAAEHGESDAIERLTEIEASYSSGMQEDTDFSIGYNYYNGLNDHPVDYDKAVYYYNRGAADGDRSCMCELGVCYYFGNGVDQSYSTAKQWFEKSANAGSYIAMYNLGYLYENGQGVSKNYSTALRWYKKSAAAGYSNAQEKVDNWTH